MAAEIEITRLVLRDPTTRAVRAVLETAPPYHAEEGADARVVRLQLFTAAGEAVLTAEVDETGEPRVYVGSRDAGPAVVLRPGGIDAWRDGEHEELFPRG